MKTQIITCTDTKGDTDKIGTAIDINNRNNLTPPDFYSIAFLRNSVNVKPGLIFVGHSRKGLHMTGINQNE